MAQIQQLKAGRRWLENNENSAEFLKRTASNRLSHHNITSLAHPTTGTIHSDIDGMLNSASFFYEQLYTEDSINSDNLVSVLDSITTALSEITFQDISKGTQRCPKRNSSGRDGLPYEILRLIIDHPACQELVLRVYNDALGHALFPASWQEICIVLLPKTGDLSNLGDWCPISLINTDCKVFTRLINSRVMSFSDFLVNRYQAIFMQGRFIGDHNMMCKLIMHDASAAHSDAVGVMLDQTKAYDRIHPECLGQVLLRFGFGEKFVKIIKTLFFGTTIVVNANRFLSRSFCQGRVLR